jgi:hypothetical protein
VGNEPEPNLRAVLSALKGGKDSPAAHPAPTEMVQGSFNLLGNPERVGMVAVPRDVTPQELLGLIFATISMGDQLQAQQPAHGLVVARSIPKA